MKKKQLFKNILIVTTVLALLLLGIGVYIIWREQTKQDKGKYDIKFGTLNSPIDTTTTESVETNFKAISSDLKTSERVYKVNLEDPFYPDDEFIQKIASTSNLSELSQGDDFILYDNKEGDSLLYETVTDSFTLKYSSRDKTQDIEKKEFVSVAIEKLKSTNLWPWKEETDYTIRESYYYTISYNYYETNDKENASLYGITFQNTIEDIPMITDRINSGAINVIMDLKGNVTQIIYSYRSANLDEYATYPILTLEEALNEIKYENFELVAPFESFIPSNVQTTDVEFAYRVEDNDQQYLQPCYFFEGTDEHGQLVTLIVPAVRDEYLTVE
jgi:hypothetical protein